MVPIFFVTPLLSPNQLLYRHYTVIHNGPRYLDSPGFCFIEEHGSTSWQVYTYIISVKTIATFVMTCIKPIWTVIQQYVQWIKVYFIDDLLSVINFRHTSATNKYYDLRHIHPIHPVWRILLYYTIIYSV